MCLHSRQYRQLQLNHHEKGSSYQWCWWDQTEIVLFFRILLKLFSRISHQMGEATIRSFISTSVQQTFITLSFNQTCTIKCIFEVNQMYWRCTNMGVHWIWWPIVLCSKFDFFLMVKKVYFSRTYQNTTDRQRLERQLSLISFQGVEWPQLVRSNFL